MSEKKVFGPFYDGREYRFADVVRVYRKLGALLDGEPNSWLEKRESADPAVADEASDRVADAITEAFDLLPFDPKTGEGMTQGQVFDVLNIFIDYLGKPETTPEPSPTSSPSTGKPCQGCR